MNQKLDTFAEDRRAGLGGSDFPKLMIPGYRYGGAYDVYLDKIEGSSFTGNNATRRGHYFESGVARWYADETGRSLHRLSPETDPILNMTKVGDEWTLVHPRVPFLRGTPDFLTDLPDLGLECKTHNDQLLQDVDWDGGPMWGPDGSDLVPTSHLLQCTWYMGLSGRRRWDLGVYFVGYKDEFRQYHLEFDPALFAEMVDVGVAFWNDHVLARVPPPIDLIPSDRVLGVLIMKGLASGQEIQATPELNQLAQDWADFQAQRLNIVDDEAEIKAKFATLMSGLGAGKVKGAIGGKNWSVGAREEKNGTRTNHSAVEAIFYRMLLDRGAAQERELEEILASNTVPSHTDAYIQGYFNSINKDRKALRAAMKATPTAEDLTA